MNSVWGMNLGHQVEMSITCHDGWGVWRVPAGWYHYYETSEREQSRNKDKERLRAHGWQSHYNCWHPDKEPPLR